MSFDIFDDAVRTISKGYGFVIQDVTEGQGLVARGFILPPLIVGSILQYNIAVFYL